LSVLAVLVTAGGVRAESESGASHQHAEPVVLAPGYADLEFAPPTAGTYALPPLGEAADARVIDVQGRIARLHDLLGDKVVVLSFIYTRCNDVNGCPLATHVLGKLQTAIADAPDLQGRVRLVSFSFDPAHDTPDVLGRYAGHFRRPGFDWRFLSVAQASDLGSVLDAYDQWVVRDIDADGELVGTLSHILRVYLIDRERQIRNIYSISFLHADTVANDIRTVLLDRAEPRRAPQG
jgi:cytochrome c peroxidase